MHKIRQILLFLDRGVSQRAIEREVKISRKTIGLYLGKFVQTGIAFSELLKLSEEELEAVLGLIKPVLPEDADPRKLHFNSLIEYFNKELSRTGVTRLLLWEEYIKEYPGGFQYSRFCELLQDQMKLNNAVMHFVHYPAKLLEVDFAGDVLHYVDPSTGELIACPVYVAVLPFSGYSYVEALPDAKLPQVVKALNNTLDYFGGVPLSVKSDNMRQWVSKSCNIEKGENVLITGATGCGKSFLACALGRSACLLGYRTQYFSMNKFLDALAQARLDGSYLKWIRGISANKLLILDDFGLKALNNDARIALLDILEDRYGNGSTMITSQLPVDSWYNFIDEPTLADAIMDRLAASAHRIALKGKSLRKKKNHYV